MENHTGGGVSNTVVLNILREMVFNLELYIPQTYHFRHGKVRKFIPFFWKLFEDVLTQNKGVKQESGMKEHIQPRRAAE